MINIKDIPKVIEKIGDGVYTIKIKKSKVVIFSKSDRYDNKKLSDLVKKEEEY